MAVVRLSDMQVGQSGTIVKINGSGNIKFRLIDMGIVKGTHVQVQKYAPLGDPIEVRVKGFSLALRNSEAETIDVEIKGEF